jgi:ribosomal protein S12
MAKTQSEIEKEFQTDRERILAQPKVKLFIPVDRSNPDKHREVIINGVQFILAVGKQLEVPQVVAEVWQDSYSRTIEAEQRMEQFNEL